MGCLAPSAGVKCFAIELACALDRNDAFSSVMQAIFRKDIEGQGIAESLLAITYKGIKDNKLGSRDKRAILLLIYGRLMMKAGHKVEARAIFRQAATAYSDRATIKNAAKYWAKINE